MQAARKKEIAAALGGGGASNPIPGLSPAAWFRYGQGITVTGSGVSQWNDASGNGRHLKQGTDTNRPALQGDGSILFDGVDNFLRCDPFTFAMPVTAYFLINPVSWTSLDMVCDGNTIDTLTLRQNGVSPQMLIGTLASSFAGPDLPVGSYAAYAAVWNGASSSGQINSSAPVAGNVGAGGDPGGFVLGCYANLAARFINAGYKEVILFSAAHSAPTRATVMAYLMRVGGL